MNPGEKIKILRTEKKITQAELAKKVNVTRSAISAYENETRNPTYDILIRISKVLHVSLDDLFGISSDSVIDVAGLNRKQINTIQEIVDTYKANNFMYENSKGNEMIENFLRESGIEYHIKD